MPDARSFQVDIRLLRELGERLISRDEVAIVELVKNSYDADATSVKVEIGDSVIIVTDDGVGMGEKELREGWLTIGASRRTSHPVTEKGRQVLGAKGIGRLAVLRLGQTIEVTTQKGGEPCYQLLMDWKKVRPKIDSTKYTPITNWVMNIRILTRSPFPEGHGTRISISDLNSEWDTGKSDRVKAFLSRLIEPRQGEESQFAIKFLSHGIEVQLEPPEITKTPHYSLAIRVDDAGAYTGLLTWASPAAKGDRPVSGSLPIKRRGKLGREWKPAAAGGCGPFSLALRVWDLDAIEPGGSRSVLREWSGVSLVRDGFRVVQPDVDWLGLDLRRVQNPTLRLSTNQMIGSVLISSSGNTGLIDKTDREGLLENEALQILKRAVYDLLELIERERYAIRRSKNLVRGVLLNQLDSAPLREMAKGLPDESRADVEQYAAQLENFRTVLEEWMMGRDRMATMGLLGARLIHEARSALMKITDNYPLIESYLPSLESPARERIGRMVEGGKLMDSLFKELDPFLRFRAKRRQDVSLSSVVDSLGFLFEPELKKNKIALRNAIPTDFVVRANLTDFYVLAANLLDNAIYWLAGKEGERIVEFRAKTEGGAAKLEVADSGPGVGPEVADLVFDVGFTTKPDGTGLGLSIVKDIVEYYGGSAEVGRDVLLGGAVFLITLPLKSAESGTR